MSKQHCRTLQVERFFRQFRMLLRQSRTLLRQCCLLLRRVKVRGVQEERLRNDVLCVLGGAREPELNQSSPGCRSRSESALNRRSAAVCFKNALVVLCLVPPLLCQGHERRRCVGRAQQLIAVHKAERAVLRQMFWMLHANRSSASPIYVSATRPG